MASYYSSLQVICQTLYLIFNITKGPNGHLQCYSIYWLVCLHLQTFVMFKSLMTAACYYL